MSPRQVEQWTAGRADVTDADAVGCRDGDTVSTAATGGSLLCSPCPARQVADDDTDRQQHREDGANPIYIPSPKENRRVQHRGVEDTAS